MKPSHISVAACIALVLCLGLAGCASAPSTGSATASHPAVGTWSWFNGGVVTINADFTMVHLDGLNIQDTGTWQALPGPGTGLRLSWASGWVDTLQLSADGKTLEGTNQDGSGVSGTR